MPFRARKTPGPLEEPALYEYAVGMLGRQMRTVAELKRLMGRRVEPGDAGKSKIAAVLARLADQKYLDDGAFASNYTRLRQENQNFGKRRVQQELARKGVQPEMAAATLDVAYAATSDQELIRRYVARKRLARPEDAKQSARLVRRLAAAGFSFGVISSLLKEWALAVELPEDDQESS